MDVEDVGLRLSSVSASEAYEEIAIDLLDGLAPFAGRRWSSVPRGNEGMD